MPESVGFWKNPFSQAKGKAQTIAKLQDVDLKLLTSARNFRQRQNILPRFLGPCFIKMSIDDKIDAVPGSGIGRTERRKRSAKNEFVDILKDINPAYG